MPKITIDSLQIGQTYHRKNDLVPLWDFAGVFPLQRGVVISKNQPYILLFVTELKSKTTTPYKDKLEGETLFWEGEEKHQHDQRIISAWNNGDQIHLFYRKRGGEKFTYFGEIFLLKHVLKKVKPSEFVFAVQKVKRLYPNLQTQPIDIVNDPGFESDDAVDESEKKALRAIRSRQQKFKNKLKQYYPLQCMISGCQIAEIIEAAHILPWTDFHNNKPSNGLLLRRDLHRLYDTSLLGIEPRTHTIVLSKQIDSSDYQKFNGKKLILSCNYTPNDEHLQYRWDRFLAEN